MSSQKQKNEQRKKLKILFSVDDIHPEIGYGLMKNHDQFKYLKKLHDEFGLKFTLFTVPVWHGNKEFEVSKKPDWIKWIQNEGFYEIAAHGYFHMNNNPQFGGAELIELPLEEITKRIQASKQMFESIGITPTGWKTPGWAHPIQIYEILPKVGFKWIADHFIGEKPITLSNGLIKVPYNCNTEHLHYAFPRDVAIFHSHISPQEGNKNGWTKELYEKTREYLLELQKQHDFECLTFSEYVEQC